MDQEMMPSEPNQSDNANPTNLGADVASLLGMPAVAYAQEPEMVNIVIDKVAEETVKDENPQVDIDGKFIKHCWAIMRQHSVINPPNAGTAQQTNPLMAAS